VTHSPTLLMTDPRFFQIKGGANPHTRNKNDSLKKVDPVNALSQWTRYVDQLEDCGIAVHVVDSAPELTGMVFAANAGFFDHRKSETRVFYRSNFTAQHRRSESIAFENFMTRFGFPCGSLDESLCFEGEADAFPIDDAHSQFVFTHGFRSDLKVASWIQGFHEKVEVFELQDPRFYHGDCLICSLGDSILAWEAGLEKGSRARLENISNVIWLTDSDASAFIANSFYVKKNGERFLFSPTLIRDDLKAEIEERGIHVIRVDISEFFTKGGGGPKCMVFNLDAPPPTKNEEILSFRSASRYASWTSRI